MDRNAAIGIMDSGIGGLTVLKELKKILPHENFLYFGDTARAPYGSRAPEQILAFMRETLEFFHKNNVKMVVIACNTTTALGLKMARKSFPFLFIGMNKGVSSALSLTKNKQIAVIATKATIESGMHRQALFELDDLVEVSEVACPAFVPLIESGMVDGEEVAVAVSKHLAPLIQGDTDTIILGCTHYPFLSAKITEAFNRKVHLIDPAKETAEDAMSALKDKCLLTNRSGKGTVVLNFSKDISVAKTLVEQFLDNDIDEIRTVNILEDIKK